jgi:5-methylcytosine-specific restriction endonuclease McrA
VQINKIIVHQLMSLQISRKDASEQGLLYYFTGKPCKHGHFSERQVSDRSCVACKRILTNKIRPKYYDKDYVKAAKKKWERENPLKCSLKVANRRAKKKNATPIWVDLKAIEKFYLERPDGYEVDHIIPLVSKTVCGLHVPWNLQYLTRSENIAKGNRFYG